MKIRDLKDFESAVTTDLNTKAEIEALEAHRKKLRDAMTDYLKAHNMTSVTIAGNRVTYAPYSVTRFEKERFEQEHAKLYAKYLKTDWFTKLTITPKKAKKTEKKAVSAKQRPDVQKTAES